MLRWSPLIVAAAVIAGGVVYVVTTEDADPQATARVGNTDEVRWPRDDVTRDLVVGLFDDPAVLDEVRSTLDDPAALLVISSDIPPNQAYVEITVAATDDQSALTAADTAAAVAVRIENERFAVDDETRLATLDASLDDYNASIAGLEAQIDELAVVEGEAYQRFLDTNTAADRTAWQLSEVDLSTAENTLNQETWRRSDVIRERDEVLADAGLDTGQVVVSRAAQLDDDTAQSGALPALLAGITAAVVASLAAIALDRSLGRARNASRLAAMVQRPTFDLATDRGLSDFVLDAGLRGCAVAVLSPESGAARAAIVLADASDTIELVSLAREADRADDLATLRSGLAQRLDGRGVMYADRIADRPGDLALAASLTTVGYLAVDQRTPLRDVRRTVQAIESRGLAVDGLVFGDPGPTPVGAGQPGGRVFPAPSEPHDQLI